MGISDSFRRVTEEARLHNEAEARESYREAQLKIAEEPKGSGFRDLWPMVIQAYLEAAGHDVTKDEPYRDVLGIEGGLNGFLEEFGAVPDNGSPGKPSAPTPSEPGSPA